MAIIGKYLDEKHLTPLRRDILKILSSYPGDKFKIENIKYHLLKYGHEGLKEKTLYSNLEYLAKTDLIAIIPLPSQGNPSRPKNFYELVNTDVLAYKMGVTIDGSKSPKEIFL